MIDDCGNVGDIRTSSNLRQHSAVFEARFARCHEMRCFLACRVQPLYPFECVATRLVQWGCLTSTPKREIIIFVRRNRSFCPQT